MADQYARRSVQQWCSTLLAGLLLTFFAGCGESTYNERLLRTSELYGYQGRLNQHLQEQWTHPAFGMSMRIPKSFRLIPAPPEPTPNEDGTVEVVADPRQPTYLGIELPGLVAAWEARGEGFLYLCTNHQRFLDLAGEGAVGADPENLIAEVEAALQQGMEFTLSEEPARSPTDLNARFDERIPSSDKFANPQNFTSIKTNKESEPKMVASVYELKADKIQFVLILVCGPAHAVRFDDSVRVGLETLKVSSAIPRKAAGTKGTATPNVQPAF